MDEGDETPPSPGTFLPPSVHREALLAGSSFTHFSPVPPALLTPACASDPSSLPPLCLGVDEAGRGPVLGPMVYGIFYLPLPQSGPLLRDTHHFDDSKALTAAARSSLMRALCTEGTDLHAQCGWATAALSARDISAGMLRPAGVYNLNAQAVDATVALIRGALKRGLNIREVYVDTVGQPAAHQARLQRVFPTTKITVAKKADSLYPCVSAASVCAKVTRDAALEALYGARRDGDGDGEGAAAGMEWGSGYPSDARCVGWLRRNMHPVFGWGPECRFSWGTAKDMLETKGGGVKVDWPVEEEGGDSMRVTDFFVAGRGEETDELGGWYGSPVGLEAF
ncbi:Ribonuclease H2 subunit A [Metarhizium acridum CQMa 102]|uniref:Ribonuclease n=1 Tax=Metarhizium acridum (strain CQMa 102) TaxID=655827 RepID=E9DZ83_METAQ|nr:Ribonuclease H2 subunit A [Metarhizium acridum CQMa 102]EFY91045.1 Ribonuclease H2 subunit A [Metarhizium acridum CQMa 102]